MEDLRYKQKIQAMHSAAQQIALDCISTQSPHGSPYHVHPYPSPVRLQHAFQPPPSNSPNMFYPKGLKPQYEQRAFASPQPSPILGRALCLTGRDSPVRGRVSHLNDRFNDSLTLSSDTDAMVANIGAMFPTVSDTHIRILLKKYHNRSAVVMSALQVEKHPLATPGPLGASPARAAARLSKGAAAVYSPLLMHKGVAPAHDYCLPFTNTPNSSPSLFRAPSGASSYYGTTLKSSDGQVTRHHSPKMKLKYLKSIFPKADEMVILEILSNNDNNVQRVSEELAKRGFVKKDSSQKKEAPVPAPAPLARKHPPNKTNNEKLLMKMKYGKLYPLIADRVITIALESVEYNEELAEQILGSVVVEEDQPRPRVADQKEPKRVTVLEPTGAGLEAPPRAQSPPAPVRRPKFWTQPLKSDVPCRPILKSAASGPQHRSNYTAPRRGPDGHLRQGPQDALLLEDYLPWSGPDRELRGGAVVRPEGPSSRPRPSSHARGPASLAKGPQGLAKGSTYHKNNNKSAKIVTT